MVGFAAGAAQAGEAIVNGGFETGMFGTEWVAGSSRGTGPHSTTTDLLVYGGQYGALLGINFPKQGNNITAWLYQEVVLPAGVSSARIWFYSRVQALDRPPYDPFSVQLRDPGDNVLTTLFTFEHTERNAGFKDSGWMEDNEVPPDGIDVSAWAGQAVRVYFAQPNRQDNHFEQWVYIDEVSLIYRMWVDLAANGDGDDVFGAIGTGAGGTGGRSGVAGDTLFYTLDVENEGTVADSYALAATMPAGWEALIDDGSGLAAFPFTTPALAVGEVRTYAVAVVSPPAAVGGVYDVIVDAVSTSDASRVDSATLRASIVDGVYIADAAIDGNGLGQIGDGGSGGFAIQQAVAGTPVAYTVEVRNSGNQTTAFDMSWVAPAGVITSVTYNSVTYAGPFSTLPVAPGAMATMTITSTGGASLPGGDHDVIVRVEAVNDPLRFDTVRAVLRLLAPRVDMIIGTSGDGIYDNTFSGLGGISNGVADKGQTIAFPLVVENESALADSFDLDIELPGGSWGAVIEIGGVDYAFPVQTPRLAPYSNATYILKIAIPGGGTTGTYSTRVHAVSTVDATISESVTAVVNVTGITGMDMLIDGNGAGVYGAAGTGAGGFSMVTANPGDVVAFSVELQSLSGPDGFDVSWSAPAGWVVTLAGQPSPISGLGQGTYTLQVGVPANAPPGNVDIVVDANKTGRTWQLDSVTGRVSVQSTARVDMVIDGNGNDVFGIPGFGGGGSSRQSAAAPLVLNYSVEVQNQGVLSDNFVIDWNRISGWVATLGGASAPMTTAPIAPGASAFYPFQVSVPGWAATGSYDYVIDAVSVSDSTAVESIIAGVDVFGPPRADLVIDGNGLNVFGPMGSGQGGSSTRAATPGAAYTSALRLVNAGSFPDSFRVQWDVPLGWPASSVSIVEGATSHTAPFWSVVVPAGGFVDYDVVVQVPAGITGAHAALINSWSSRPPNDTESVALVTVTDAFIRGIVFDDTNHDGSFDPGEGGLIGVTITELSTGRVVVTGASGGWALTIPAGTNAVVVETNPSGFISTSPDTLGPVALAAGDTLTADFGDVPPVYLSPGAVANGLAGSYVDFPHRVEAGTAGQVALNTRNSVGATTMLYFDVDGNGVFNGADRPLTPADLLMDPATNPVVAILLRVFVPAALAPGVSFQVTLDAVQSISGTPLTSATSATDAVLVIGSSIGNLALQKIADRPDAAPGDVITYEITFLNTGADSLQNVVLVDPISAYVAIEPDGFGAGLDVEWIPDGGAPVYLTFNNADADECEYSPAERMLRLFLSKNGPYYVAPGGTGIMRYRVRVQ